MMCPANLLFLLVLAVLVFRVLAPFFRMRLEGKLFYGAAAGAAFAAFYAFYLWPTSDPCSFKSYGPFIVFAGAVPLVYLLAQAWTFYRRRRIEDWALENRCEVLSWRRTWFWEGPNPLFRGKNQSVYRIRVRDAEGREREGWLTVGSFWGLDPEKTQVQWDEEGTGLS